MACRAELGQQTCRIAAATIFGLTDDEPTIRHGGFRRGLHDDSLVDDAKDLLGGCDSSLVSAISKWKVEKGRKSSQFTLHLRIRSRDREFRSPAKRESGLLARMNRSTGTYCIGGRS